MSGEPAEEVVPEGLLEPHLLGRLTELLSLLLVVVVVVLLLLLLLLLFIQLLRFVSVSFSLCVGCPLEGVGFRVQLSLCFDMYIII